MPIKTPFSKRFFDLVAGSCLLVALLPVMLFIALLIWLAHGMNPIFTQRRTGAGEGEFTIYKFRTMSESLNDGYKPLFVHRGDTRVTPLGRILRNTSLDELPQLFNVLKGDMSLVGPRPQPLNHLSYYGERIPGYRARLRMRPGIMGLVQITPLRYPMDSIDMIAQRVSYDLYYIDHWSLWLDIWICWKTMQVVLNPRKVAQQMAYFDDLRRRALSHNDNSPAAARVDIAKAENSF